MPTSTTFPGEIAKPQHYFATTHWTVVLAAGRVDDPGTAARLALDQLCRSYWFPLYAYVRRRGHSAEDAEDLTQEFFRALLEKNSLKAADRDKGRFRTFLLVALRNFLANEWDRARALKRGGAVDHVSFDTSAAEARYQVEAADDANPDRVFDRRWALALLSKTMERTRAEFTAAGKSGEFDQIKACLAAERGTINYGAISRATGMNEGALRVAVHRLRRRFREIFREEIAHTVAAPEEIDDEVRYLMGVLAE